MKPFLSISAKGLLLISVTFIFQLALTLVLSRLLVDLHEATERARKVTSVVAAVNDLAKHSYLVMDTIMTIDDTGSSQMVVLALEGPRNVFAAKKRLKDLVRNDPASLARVQRIIDVGAKAIETISVPMLEGTPNFLSKLGDTRIKENNSDVLVREATALIRELDAEETRSINAINSARSRLVTAVAAGAALNIVITLILAWLFGVHIVRRLKVVRDNAVRLSQEKELLPRVGGRDEISRLDDVFHETARQLNQLQERKRDYLTMISHDIRTPLTTVQMSLDLINSDTYGTLDRSGQKRLAQDDENMQVLSMLIDDLLTLEKLKAGKLVIQWTNVSAIQILEQAVERASEFTKLQSVTIDFDAANPSSQFDLKVDEELFVNVLSKLLSLCSLDAKPGSVLKLACRAENEIMILNLSFAPSIQLQEEEPNDLLDNPGSPACACVRGLLDNSVILELSKRVIEIHGGTIALVAPSFSEILLKISIPIGSQR